MLTGSLLFMVRGREVRLDPGSRIEIPRGTPHTFRNEGPGETHSIQEFRPALRIAEFFETRFTLSQLGQLSAAGMPSPFQIALSAPEFGREIQLASVPWLVQRVALTPLAPLARLRGLRPAYRWDDCEPGRGRQPAESG